MSVLLLGGTQEARRLAEALVDADVAVVSSLAGEATATRRPPGEVRFGGFGGATGLADYLRHHAVAAVVDATHPFAARITEHAAEACTATGVALLRLERPSWAERSDAAGWHWVDSLAEAGEVAGRLGDRVFLAVGRQSLAEVTGLGDRYVLARVIDPPDVARPPRWEVRCARGPFHVDEERRLLCEAAIDVLVTKDSGGPASAKLDVAAELGLPVVVVRRPALPEGLAVVRTVAEAVAWVNRFG